MDSPILLELTWRDAYILRFGLDLARLKAEEYDTPEAEDTVRALTRVNGLLKEQMDEGRGRLW